MVSAQPLAENKWQHVAVVYDGSSKASGVKIYIDGKLVSNKVEQDSLRDTIATETPFKIGSRSSGAVRLVMDVRGSIVGKHVLIVEDIVDTGHTLKYLIGMLHSHGPASVKTCALVRKAERAEVEVDVDYLGFDIPDKWVVGYGLDYAEQHRTLPYIGIVSPDD